MGGPQGKEEEVRKIILLCTLALGFTALASPGGVIFILDASNSMNISFQGMPRIQWAKDALSQLVTELPVEMPFGIVVFGHRIAKDLAEESCRDVELALEVGVHGADVRAQIVEWVQGIEAKGKTPLAYALRFAAERGRPRCRIVLITDGMETCGGDPVAVARELSAEGCAVDVVGLAVKSEEEEALRELAAAGGGRYWRVEELGALLATLREVIAAPPIPQRPAIPPEFACYNVDPEIVSLLLEHLPYPLTDPMWCVILGFLERNPPANVVVGTEGADILFGTYGNDLILGLGGTDKVLGFGGNDLLIGGPCSDIVQGGDGDDLIIGGSGDDILLGGISNDIIYGEGGSDKIEGEGGDDALYGGPSNDILLGGPGCNYLDGGLGDNFLYDEGSCPSCERPQVLCPHMATRVPKEGCESRGRPAHEGVKCGRKPGAAKVVVEGQCIPLKAKVYDPDCNIASVTWSADAGTFSDPHALETTWCAPLVTGCEGRYVTLTLEAVDSCGAKTVSSKVIYVRNVNRPPRVDAGPDLVVDEGGTVRLQASATDPDGDPLSYTWILDYTRGTLDDPHSLNPLFTAPYTSNCRGEYVTLTFEAQDVCGAVARDTVRIFVRNVNKAPWVDAGGDITVQAGETVRLCARAGDPDGEPVQVYWSIIGGEGTISDPTSPVTSFTAPVYRGCDPVPVKLAIRAVDPCGADAVDYLTVTVIPVNTPPQVEIDP